jgi:hypothetical protein
MADNINTKKRNIQYNGPVDSSDYNARVEENYEDLVYLYNKANITDIALARAFERVFKDQIFLSMAVKDLDDRIKALESSENVLSIHSFSQIVPTDFVDTSFFISRADNLTFDPIYNTVTLPKISSSSISKLKFGSFSSGQFIPDFFKARIDNSFAGVDIPGAIVESTPLYHSLLDQPDKVWSRTIIANEPDILGAQCMLYIQVPSEVTGSTLVNNISLSPYPYNSVNIVSIEYTSDRNPTLSNSDRWFALNRRNLYDGNQDAIGRVPPGGWGQLGSDTIINSGPISFTFAETNITALRIKMSQRNYFKELNKYIYTYGLSNLDVRLNKYLNTGRTIVKFTAPQGQLINEVTNVLPKIYNIPLSQMSSAFSYRVIYDDSGVYTLSNPGASSSVWIELTLNRLQDGTVPVLSDLLIQYI